MEGRRFSKQRNDLVVAIITIFSVYIAVNVCIAEKIVRGKSAEENHMLNGIGRKKKRRIVRMHYRLEGLICSSITRLDVTIAVG